MDNQLIDLTYQTYEKYSTKYIIGINQIEKFINCIDTKTQKMHQIIEQLDQMVSENCYYNLSTVFIDDFQNKLTHNIKLARQNNDSRFLYYLTNKFQIASDLMIVDLQNWTYQPKKIKLQLKPTTKNCVKDFYLLDQLLAQLLGVSVDKKFNHVSDITKLIHKYIYVNQLQNRSDKNCIDPNNALTHLLLPLEGESRYTYYNLNKYLQHLIKRVKET